MSATPPVNQQLPYKIAEMLDEQEEPLRRKFCDWLAHWRHCNDPACRRAHACAGDPTACLPAAGAAVRNRPTSGYTPACSPCAKGLPRARPYRSPMTCCCVT
jgi:hypothetical protein